MTDSSAPPSPALLAETGSALVPTAEAAGPPATGAATAEPRWTGERMAAFILELAATQCVATAARRVGMSRQSAYKLRAREEGKAFDLAWALALEQAFRQLQSAALARALNGTEVPVYQRGELIGTRQHFDERLTCFLLGKGRQYQTPVPHKRRADLDQWQGRFEELVEQVRAGAAQGHGSAGDTI
jgi:hypothetical protein